MTEPAIGVYRVREGDGFRDYVSLLPGEHVFSRGLTQEGILGVLTRPLREGEPITPEAFAPNPAFVAFLHGVVARQGPSLPGMMAEARRQAEGWVYLIDGRTPTPQGDVLPEDIIGAFEVRGGEIVADSYRANPNHRLLTPAGFFRPPAELLSALLAELMALA